jgi:hypothetical protein
MGSPGPYPMHPKPQRPLFCQCGKPARPRAASCLRCYHRRYHSKRCFNGLREGVLRRDAGQCVACGCAPAVPHVHHRKRINRRVHLVTLCATCHARLHLYNRLPRYWIPPMLAMLWHEQHPGAPLQLQLGFEAAA